MNVVFNNFLIDQNAILISGGYDGNSRLTNIEVIGDSDTKLPPLPEGNSAHSMVITNNNELMILGGNCDDEKQCYKLVNGKWQKQNPLTQPRKWAVRIVMPNGIYCFGGEGNRCTSDFLPNGQNEWQTGPEVPWPGIDHGHGVAISVKELLLVGGVGTENKMLKFNIERQEWSEIGSLLQERSSHSCFFYNENVIVTGGFDGYKWLKSTEIIKLSNWTPKKAGDLNVQRSHHGMGIVDINGKSKLIVFGGWNGSHLDSIEEWDEVTETWSMSNMKLSEPKNRFGYCQLPQS